MTTTTLNLQTVTLAGYHPGATETSPSVPQATAAGHPTRWQAVAVDMDGNVCAFVPLVAPNPVITWELDVATEAVFHVPLDYDATALPLANAGTSPPREVQLWRNGSLLFWGPPTARQADSQNRVWEYTAYDPLWYLTHRYFGEASRKNYVTNGDFETNLNGWTAFGTTTMSQSTTQAILGTHSMKLVGTVTEAQEYAYTRFAMTAGAEGLALTLTAWVYVESYAGEDYGARGAYIERQSSPGVVVTDLQAWSEQPFSDTAAPVGQWSRLTTFVEMPANVTETIEVRLYSPNGTVYWDAVTVTIEESLSLINLNSAGGAGWDQTLIAQTIVKYLAGTFPIGATYTKSDLRISVAGGASGITKQRTYLFSDHQNGFDALTEFTASSDGFDFRLEITPTTRTFRTYYPSVGQTWTGIPFAYVRDDGGGSGGRSWGIVGYTQWQETIEGAASDVTEMGGWGTGSGREEGGYSDTSLFGGLTLELVESAPNEAPIDLLAAIAASRGAQLGKVLTTPTLTMKEPKDPDTDTVLLPLIGILLPGDILDLIIDDGGLQFNGTVRVAKVVLNDDETLAVSVNP